MRTRSSALTAVEEVTSSEVLVVGAGAAGLSVALGMVPRRVSVVTRGRLGLGGSSPMAQGGIAAAVGADDSPARHAADMGLFVHAGHGLTYANVAPIAAIPEIEELNIGHSIVSRAVLVGMERAVRDMVEAVRRARAR